jgi:hypothetical protein
MIKISPDVDGAQYSLATFDAYAMPSHRLEPPITVMDASLIALVDGSTIMTAGALKGAK